MSRHPLDPVTPAPNVNPYTLLRRGEIDDDAAIDLAMREYCDGTGTVDSLYDYAARLGIARAWLRIALLELRARDLLDVRHLEEKGK